MEEKNLYMTGGLDSSTLSEMPLFRGLYPEQLSKINTLLNKRFPAAIDIITVE